MTDKERAERKILGKQLAKALRAISKAESQVALLSSLLHDFGYLYNASVTNNEIIFLPCDDNYDITNPFDEKNSFDNLKKTGNK